MIPQAHRTVERKSITVLELPRGNPRGSAWGDSRVGAPPRRGSLGKRWGQLCRSMYHVHGKFYTIRGREPLGVPLVSAWGKTWKPPGSPSAPRHILSGTPVLPPKTAPNPTPI